MNELLQLVTGKDITFIVQEIFLQALPPDVIMALTSSSSNLTNLMAEVNLHFISTGA